MAKTDDAPEVKGGLPVLAFADVPALERWYDANAESSGLWMRLARAGSGQASVTRAEALDVALCYGWIDGQAAAGDDTCWLQRFTPRRRGSRWSQINCGKAEALITAGRMQDRGLAEVESAKADGRWEAAYAGPRTAQVPPDLQSALDESPTAAAFFVTLTSQNRFAILFRIESVKRAETRARKIAQYVTMLEAGETIYPQ